METREKKAIRMLISNFQVSLARLFSVVREFDQKHQNRKTFDELPASRRLHERPLLPDLMNPYFHTFVNRIINNGYSPDIIQMGVMIEAVMMRQLVPVANGLAWSIGQIGSLSEDFSNFFNINMVDRVKFPTIFNIQNMLNSKFLGEDVIVQGSERLVIEKLVGFISEMFGKVQSLSDFMKSKFLIFHYGIFVN